MHLRNDWTRAETQALYQQPFLDLVCKRPLNTPYEFIL